MNSSLFSGRKLCIATKHGKEKVIAPILEEAFGVTCFVLDAFDTDKLGTFSGEVERVDDPIEAARKKCLLAMEQSKCDLAIASEGSFGNHPNLFFVPANEEFIVLMDQKNQLEIVARHLTTETNFKGQSITTTSELEVFAGKAGFPDHALILKSSEKDWSYIRKGITSARALNVSFQECMKEHGAVYVETDMRAMHNPSRMVAIRETMKRLKQKMDTKCPNCQTPGFDLVEVQPGLPCKSCTMPTKAALHAIYRCSKCNYEKKNTFPNGKTQEEPMYCDFCNP